MAFKRLELSKPSIATERRFIEIEFVIVVDVITQGFAKRDTYDMIQMLCRATKTDVNLMFIAYNNLKKLNRKPQKLEIVLLYRYKGFSIKEIQHVTSYIDKYGKIRGGIAPNTQTNYVNKYINDDEPDLIPQLSMPNVHEEMYKFIRGYHEKIGKASLLTAKAGDYFNYEIV